LTVMSSQNEQDERIEALRALIERLSAPDLTLTEAEVLRGQLSDLLEPCDGTAGGDRTEFLPVLVPYHDISDGPRHILWSPEPSMWAVG
jgi:hypothetical protein